MTEPRAPIVILIAEDDDEDFYITQKALKMGIIDNILYRVKDGEELLDYLLHRKHYAHEKNAPWPDIIFLDLNMPKMDGREALKVIKQHKVLKRIPVIALTTSEAEDDILHAYTLGANSFIKKPITFKEFVEKFKVIEHYWFDIVQLPVNSKGFDN